MQILVLKYFGLVLTVCGELRVGGQLQVLSRTSDTSVRSDQESKVQRGSVVSSIFHIVAATTDILLRFLFSLIFTTGFYHFLCPLILRGLHPSNLDSLGKKVFPSVLNLSVQKESSRSSSIREIIASDNVSQSSNIDLNETSEYRDYKKSKHQSEIFVLWGTRFLETSSPKVILFIRHRVHRLEDF